jgi:hypothetical protein
VIPYASNTGTRRNLEALREAASEAGLTVNAFELAIIRVARQYEEKLRNGPVSDKEWRQGERVMRWAEAILEKRHKVPPPAK